MPEFARPEDREALAALWEASFDGPPGYADFYYSRRFVPEDTLVWREGGRPVSMMTMMRVRRSGEEGVYIYAVATLPAYRGRGLMTRLDEFSKEAARERGAAFSVLVPAEAGLFPMYGKLGYRAGFSVWRGEVNIPAKEPGDFSPCGFSEFCELRRRFLFRVPGAVLHPEKELRYVYDELRAFSGDVYQYEAEGKRCYAAFSIEEGGVLLREDSGPDPVRTARQLLLRFGGKRAVIRSARFFPGARKVPFGMGRRLSGGGSVGGYMALMLD